MQMPSIARSVVACAAFALALAGCRTIEPAPPPDAPRIESFTVSTSRISPGESVTLSFTTVKTTRVEVLDDAGNEVQLGGTIEAGTATVAPTRTTFYVLRATGVGGRDTAFVQIAVNEALRDVFLIPVPASIRAGEQAQLLWGAAGASSVTLTGSGAPVTLQGTTGSVTVTPEVSQRYTLTATGAQGTPPLTALADVRVQPVLAAAALDTPDGVGPMKTLTLSWRTLGADRVILSEQTFGRLTTITEPSSVAMGTFDYVLPEKLPSGIDVTDGLPLRFSVVAAAGTDFTGARVLETSVGVAPVIEVFNAPTAGTTGGSFTLNWRTLNATAVEVRVGALPIWASLPGDVTRATRGQVTLPTPAAQTEYTFVALNDRANESRTFTVRPVAPPTITTFTLTPTVNMLGQAANAAWSTANATSVQLVLDNGAALATVTVPSQVATGSLGLQLATSQQVTLVARNAAGDSASLTRAFTFAGPVTVTPSPVLRGTPVTLSWVLAPAGVFEVVGLPTPAQTPIAASVAFVDLSTRATAAEVLMQDPQDGLEPLRLPTDFQFPLLGTVRRDLWVSVNGFIAFSAAGAPSLNVDLTGSTTAPTLLAPFWDDLTLGTNSKILVDTITAASGERIVVVQWHRLTIAGDGNSELTFQAHLYATGQVGFIYKTVNGMVNSATIGVRDAERQVVQQYAFNSMMTVPSADLELNYFSGGAGDGSVVLASAVAGRLTFFGRTATGLVAASADVRAFGPGDVVVTEAMPRPEASVMSTGQWLELRNALPGTTDFGGLRLRSSTSTPDGGFVIPDGTLVDAGAFLVLGQSVDGQLNGGAPVALEYTDVPLAVPGFARVEVQSQLADAGLTLNTLASLAWDAGTAPVARSVAPISDLLVASGSTFACPRTATFGSAGALGTPGVANEPCAPYAISSIPGNFVPAPPGSELTLTGSGDEGYGNLTLPVPFPYYATPTTSLGVSTNGFVNLGAAPLAAATFTNPTVPSTAAPNGTVAPFWDDLDRGAGKNALWRAADRTIISWEAVSFFGQTATTSVLNFQVHLVDTGVIEFHYGDLSTTSTTSSVIARHAGGEATTWLERQDGTIAVVRSVNQPTVLPRSGVRFTPIP